jgi:hypothetical protein
MQRVDERWLNEEIRGRAGRIVWGLGSLWGAWQKINELSSLATSGSRCFAEAEVMNSAAGGQYNCLVILSFLQVGEWSELV